MSGGCEYSVALAHWEWLRFCFLSARTRIEPKVDERIWGVFPGLALPLGLPGNQCPQA